MIDILVDIYTKSFENVYRASALFRDATYGMDVVATLMATVGVALLTILVPFAIAVMSNFLRWESEKREDAFLTLDLHVVLERVFVLKSLLMSAALIFLPTLFWVGVPMSRLVGMALWALGIVWLTIMIYRVYEWRTIHDLEIRFRYLMALNDPIRMNVVWPSVWVAARMDDGNERRYLSIFSEKVSMLMDARAYSSAIFLLDNFQANLANRFDLSLFVGERSFFVSLLGWRYHIYTNMRALAESSSPSSDDQLALEHTARIVHDLSVSISRLAIGNRHSFWFFNSLYEHAQSVSDDPEYRRKLMSELAPVLLDEAYERRGRDSVWEGFPDDWKVTRSTLHDERETVADLWREEVVAWMITKVQSHEQVDGAALLSVVGALFPEADPNMLLRAFILAYASREKGEGRVEAVVATAWPFGFVRDHAPVGDRADDRRSTTAAIINHFRELTIIFSKENITRMRAELASLGTAIDADRAALLVDLLDAVEAHRHGG